MAHFTYTPKVFLLHVHSMSDSAALHNTNRHLWFSIGSVLSGWNVTCYVKK